MVYRITYNVYRLNTVGSRNVIQGFQGIPPLNILCKTLIVHLKSVYNK